MEGGNLSRRSLLQAIAAVMASTATSLGWPDVVQAMAQVHAVGHVGTGAKFSFLTGAEAADVEAVAAQIIPSDDSPGAREAGVVHFVDRALGTFFSQLASDYRVQLDTFQAGYRERYP